jgi:predicted nucleic acid-binding Zn ribbon protein
MPLYEYRCEANGEVVEVVHRMADKFTTWGQLCEHTARALGDVPADSPVTKLIGSGNAGNAPWTAGKQLKADAKASTNLKHGATVSPMRSKNF